MLILSFHRDVNSIYKFYLAACTKYLYEKKIIVKVLEVTGEI